MMGNNKKVDVVVLYLLCIAVASVMSVHTENVSADVKKCNEAKCETPKGDNTLSSNNEKGKPSSSDEKGGSTKPSTPSNNDENTEKSELKPSTPSQPGKPGKGGEQNIEVLCQGALYKDACSAIMSKVINGSGSTEDMIKAAALLALQGVEKILGVTESFTPKPNPKQNPEVEMMAVNDCKDLFATAVERLKVAINKITNPDTYKLESQSFTLRLWLSDVLTFADNCMDAAIETGSTDLHATLKDDVANATEITMVTLDVFTGFVKIMSSIGINPSNIIDTVKGLVTPEEEGTNGGRRLLGGATDMLGDDGVPRWLSATDRRLLNLDGNRNERVLAGVPPNAVVALDGSGQFKRIIDAINAYDPKAPLPPGGKYVIYVKAGIYDEFVVIQSKFQNIFMYGDGPTKTVVTGRKSFEPSKTSTMNTASFAIQAANFFCKDMGFENTAGPKGGQAVALRSNGEQHVFLNCHFNGYQDTLYVQGGSQFFRDCVITGTVDFIFGNGATMIQHSDIIARDPSRGQSNMVTAQGRTGPSMPTGIVIQDCRIFGDAKLDKANTKTYLGRPWKAYARTVFMESDIGDLIAPEGYMPFTNNPNTENSIYAEYMNTGPGSATNLRVTWPHVIKQLSREEAQTYTVARFLPGADVWLRAAAVPFGLGLK